MLRFFRVQTKIYADAWYPWMAKICKAKVIKYEDGQRKQVTRQLYVTAEKGAFFMAGLYPEIEAECKKLGIQYEYLDMRPDDQHYRPEAYQYDYSRLEGDLRHKQDAVIEAVTHNDKGIILCPTGFGKSFVIRQIARVFPNARIVICTKKSSVVTSLYKDLCKSIGSEQVGLLKSGTKSCEESKRVIVTTTLSLTRAPIESCDFLLFDEVHNVGDNQVFQLLQNHIGHARMFGFTASLYRGDKALRMVQSLFGEVLVTATYQEAVEHNMVVPIYAMMIDCRTKFRETKSMLALDKKICYWWNYDRNRLINDVAADTPPVSQTMVMVETLEHMVKLMQFDELKDYVWCHSGGGTKARKLMPWDASNAPDVVDVVHKRKGTLHHLELSQNYDALFSYRDSESGVAVTLKDVFNGFVTKSGGVCGYDPSKYKKPKDLICRPWVGSEAPEEVICFSKTTGKKHTFNLNVAAADDVVYRDAETGEVLLFDDLFNNFKRITHKGTLAESVPCGAMQTVDRAIKGVDVQQFKIDAKEIAKIQTAFEKNDIKKMICTNIFSEGVNFAHCKHLIRCDGGVSKIADTQVPGRLSRLCPGKDAGYLYDFNDTFSPWAQQRSNMRFAEYVRLGWAKSTG